MKPDLKKRADALVNRAILQKDCTIGRHASAVIARDGDISIETLRKSLIDEIEQSPSKLGTSDSSLDIQRIMAEKALVHLLTIQCTDAL